MVLLDGLFLEGEGRLVGSRPGGGGFARLQRREALLELLHILTPEASRQGDHDPVRTVVLPHIGPQPLARHFAEGGLPAQDGPGQGGAPVDLQGQPLGTQVLGVILIHADLLQDDPPLGLHILLGKAGGEEHITENIGGQGQVGVQYPGVEAGALLGGESVDLSTDGVHLLGQGGGGAPLGPLEYHVLNKMGRPVLAHLLMARAGAHPDAQRRRAHAGHRFGTDAHAVGQ